MSAVTVSLTGVCAGGNHLTFSVTGDASRTQVLDLSVLSAPVDPAEVEAFLKVVCKLVKNGRTTAQARALLQAGVTVTV